MIRQKTGAMPDSWRVTREGDQLWVSRVLPPGWLLAHRILLERGNATVVETRLSWPDGSRLPIGGIGSEVLRRASLRGAREAARGHLSGRDPRDLTDLEPSAPSSGRRRSEERLWSLALASLAYVRAVQEGSLRPVEDAALALGLKPRVVRDRLYAARQVTPRLVTGGGNRGVVGQPELTDAAWQALFVRIRRTMTALGMPLNAQFERFWANNIGAFAAVMAVMNRMAVNRIPDYADLDLDELAARAAALGPGALKDPLGQELELTPSGLDVRGRIQARP